jgi:hypothetical protein
MPNMLGMSAGLGRCRLGAKLVNPLLARTYRGSGNRSHNPAPTYDHSNPMDEPNPASWRTSGATCFIGGDCLAWAHTMSDAMTALGIGPYGLDHVNEGPEDNPGNVESDVTWTDGRTYFRGRLGGGAFNAWQGVCKSGTGSTCYSVQGPHMATYDVMNDAPTMPPFTQPFDNVHAFEWYLWLRPRLPGEGTPYPPGYGEVEVREVRYVYCTNIPNP